MVVFLGENSAGDTVIFDYIDGAVDPGESYSFTTTYNEPPTPPESEPSPVEEVEEVDEEEEAEAPAPDDEPTPPEDEATPAEEEEEEDPPSPEEAREYVAPELPNNEGLESILLSEGSGVDQLTITLLWNTDDDLDVSFTCDDGQILNWNNMDGPNECGAVYDVEQGDRDYDSERGDGSFG